MIMAVCAHTYSLKKTPPKTVFPYPGSQPSLEKHFSCVNCSLAVCPWRDKDVAVMCQQPVEAAAASLREETLQRDSLQASGSKAGLMLISKFTPVCFLHVPHNCIVY